MKKLLTLCLLSFLLFFGCNQESEILAPVEEPSNQEYTLISLPAPADGLNIETLYTEYKEIDGNQGGKFEVEFSYQGGPFGEITVKSKLDFHSNAFEGINNISQTLDSDFAAMSFGPSMQFNQRVRVDIKIEGLDLSNVNPETLEFVYIDNNGTTQFVEYRELTMDVSLGKLEVDDAVLPHFSRYGFVN